MTERVVGDRRQIKDAPIVSGQENVGASLGTDWAKRFAIYDKTGTFPPIAVTRRETQVFDRTTAASGQKRMDTILAPESPFNKFQLTQFAAELTEQIGGEKRPDGTTVARLVDDSAKDGDIYALAVVTAPRTDTHQGGLSIEVSKQHGEGRLVQSLKLGSVSSSEPPVHHATVVTSVSVGSDMTCAVTGKLLPSALVEIGRVSLPETHTPAPEEKKTPDLKVEGKKFCTNLVEWVDQVRSSDN